MQMTQQYLAGELSVLLAPLPTVATSPESLESALALRRLAETVPITALAFVVAGALDLVDGLCRESLERGNVSAFTEQSGIGAELREFGLSARLLADR